jgi:hypothetical protein
MIITNILFGLILIAVGTLMVKYNFRLTNMFSHYNWFERNLGSGSTYIVMQALAIFIIIYGTMTLAGFSDNFWAWVTSPLRGLFGR